MTHTLQEAGLVLQAISLYKLGREQDGACVRQVGFTVQLMAISSCKNQDFKLEPPVMW